MAVEAVKGWEYMLGAGGVTALIVGLWSRIKGLFSRLFSHVVVTNKCSRGVGTFLVSYLNETSKRSKYGPRAYSSDYLFVRSLDRMRRVVFQELGGTSQLFWLNRWPVWVSSGSAESERGQGGGDFPFTLSYLRGSVDWDGLLRRACEWEETLTRRKNDGYRRYGVTRYFGHGRDRDRGGNETNGATPRPAGGETSTHGLRFNAGVPLHCEFDDIGPRQSATALDVLSLSPSLDAVVDEIRFWHGAESWYRDRGIPWRRGYLFYGQPGTGKTSLARGIAEDLDLPVFVYDLSSMTNAELITYWRQMLSQTPCLALLEDVDGVFHGRENVTNEYSSGGLTFDCLLNCLDGVERPDGLLVVVTTNRLEHLDDALGRPSGDTSSRPGRIDRAVEFTPIDEAGRLKMARRIVGEGAASLAREGKDDTAAQFQERCFRVALAQKFAEVAGNLSTRKTG